MPNIEMEFPHVFVAENLKSAKTIKDKLNRQEVVNKTLRESYRGVVDKDGKWGVTLQGQILSPGGGWDITKLAEGQYKVTHIQGYQNIALSVTPLQSPCTLELKENNSNYFVVHTMVDGKYYDMPFAFTLTRVVSLSAQPTQVSPQSSFSLGNSPSRS